MAKTKAIEANTSHGPGVCLNYRTFREALCARDDMAIMIHGAEWNSGVAAAAHSLALRVAPTLERVFCRPRVGAECDRATLAVVPFPARALCCEIGVDLSSYLAAVANLATQHVGVVLAEPGHDWLQHIEEWDFLAPYLDAAPTWITMYRPDRLLRVDGIPVAASVLLAGDLLEIELKAAAKVAGLPFHVESDGPGMWRSIGEINKPVFESIELNRIAKRESNHGK